MAVKFYTPQPLIMCIGRKRKKKFVSILSLPFFSLLASIHHRQSALSYGFIIGGDSSPDVLFNRWSNVFNLSTFQIEKFLHIILNLPCEMFATTIYEINNAHRQCAFNNVIMWYNLFLFLFFFCKIMVPINLARIIIFYRFILYPSLSIYYTIHLKLMS